MPNGDDGVRQRMTNLLSALFALVTGAMLFLPSILGVIKAPYTQKWLLFTFWVASAVALLLLAWVIYILRFSTSARIPQRRAGVGFWASVIALLALAGYIGTNAWQDRAAPPDIASIEIAPLTPEPGEMVRFSASVVDQDGDRLNYRWLVDDQQVSSDAVAHWRAPRTEGAHTVNVYVDDGRPNVRARRQAPFAVRDKGVKMDRSKLLAEALSDAVSTVRRRRPARAIRLEKLLQTSIYEDLMKDFDPEDEATIQRLLVGAFVRAATTYSDQDWQMLLKGKRPCCTDYPGTWPACDPDC